MSILARIRAHGGDVVRDQWRVSVRKGRLTAEALAWVAKHRDELMAEVWSEHEAWEERAAIKEYCGGMSRADAERSAFEEVATC